MANIERNLELHYPEPHAGGHAICRAADAHLQAHKNYGRFSLMGHRGWRKTSLLVNRVAHHIMPPPYGRGLDAGWYAPTSKPILNALNDVWVKALNTPTENGRDRLNKYLNKSEMILRLPHCGAVNFFSLELADNSAGPTLSMAVLDEAQSIDSGIQVEILDPILEKGYEAYGLLEFWKTGTVNREGNPFNDFWDDVKFGLSPNAMGALSWRIPIAAQVVNDELVPMDSPFAHPYYTYEWALPRYNRARDRGKGINWRIEWLCEGLTKEGNQFTGVDACCCLPFEQRGDLNAYWKPGYQPKSSGNYSTGIDVAETGDQTVIAVIDLDLNELVYLKYWTPGSWQPIYDAIMWLMRAFPGTPVVDTTGNGGHVVQTMAKLGCYCEGYKINQYNKVGLLDNLASMVSNCDIRLFDLDDVKEELLKMEKKALPSGGYHIAAKKGAHDDIPIALAFACQKVIPKMVKPASLDDLMILDKSPFYADSAEMPPLWQTLGTANGMMHSALSEGWNWTK